MNIMNKERWSILGIFTFSVSFYCSRHSPDTTDENIDGPARRKSNQIQVDPLKNFLKKNYSCLNIVSFISGNDR